MIDTQNHTKSNNMNNSFNTPPINNRHFNTPSPIVFPSASPTPKLFSTPTKKLPEVQKPWQEMGIEPVPQNSTNFSSSSYHHNNAVIYNTRNDGGMARDYHHNFDHYNNREKPNHTPTMSPLSMMMLESDTQLDDEDISSYKFSEEDLLSSIISSRPPSTSSISDAPFYHRRRPASFSSPSPQLLDQLSEEDINEEEDQDNDKPTVGSPFAPAPNEDPIVERPRRFSVDSPLPHSYKDQKNAAANAQKSDSNTRTNLLGAFGKNFMSRVKKASGKPFK